MSKTIQVYGFPLSVSLEEVKDFLERYTGKDTIYALKLRQNKRAYAIVQFKTTINGEQIISLASKRLWYGSSYLRAWKMDRDIVSNPRDPIDSIEGRGIKLHFGCQISSERFCVLWKCVNVTLSFGFRMKQIRFYLDHGNVEYKLDLSYENIWQIQLHRPRGQAVKFLLIQLLGAPRIYEKEGKSYEELYEPVLNYFMDTADDQWVRTTDFTESHAIGQSSALCIELPLDRELPNLYENFVYYKEGDGRFVLEGGISYSRNMELVPIVDPPRGANVSYSILFKICVLVQSGCLSGPTLDGSFYRLVDPHRIDIACIEHALEKLFHLKECCYEPVKWLQEQYRKFMISKKTLLSHTISLDDGLLYIRRVQITPSKVYFSGPEANVSNRVLRNYPDDIDNFLRVNFIDEELGRINSIDLSPKISYGLEKRRTKIYGRILSILRNGICIGDRKFEFLAFSSSQLRDNSAWFFASRPGLTAVDIRRWMGHFHHIKNVAKYAARLGQSFGSSKETLTVGREDVDHIPDVEVQRGNTTYVFSDGIGKISSDFSHRVAIKYGLKDNTPSAFQIRYGGYKGVVAVDPTSDMKLSLRKSMHKYDSDNRKLDVLAFSKYQPCFLNRQIISLLSTLGVKDHVFEKRQKKAVEQLNNILTDSLQAQEALELMSPGENTNILKEMLMCGYKPFSEPFLRMMLHTFRASKLMDLRTRSRIFVPDGRSMMGCLDETRTLEYGQVFVQYSGASQNHILKRSVVVAKNPCLHPGDVRILQAVDVLELHHMVDCVVFPQKGYRPHPNECSGSDLDGDIYFVCWDRDLVPPRQEQPMDYTPAPAILLDHDVTIEEVEEYFVNYIVNDSLGIIANAHTVFADHEPKKAMSQPCIDLAKLFSIAVDFPKTGIPAIIPQNLFVREYPDFMEKPDKTTYQSENVIGKLFRAVKNVDADTEFGKHFTREVAKQSYDPDMEFDGFEDYVDDAFFRKTNYDLKLGNLMEYYGIKTEAEILSGGFMKMGKSFNQRRDAEAINLAVRSLRKEARGWFNEKGYGLELRAEESYAKASAWYFVTYHPSYWGCYNEGMERDHYLSFPWCVYDKLVHIKKMRARTDISKLNKQFMYGLNLR